MYQAEFIHDATQNCLTVTVRINATSARVWQAWTEHAQLDQWWGPKPWHAVTKSFDLSNRGHWHYCMTGPEGEEQWCKVTYNSINPRVSFTATDAFCDVDGNPSTTLPTNDWCVSLHDHIAFTEVVVKITFNSSEDMRKIIEMGFEQGFSASLNQLQELLTAPNEKTSRRMWKVQIDAPREQVWHRTFDMQYYIRWTAAFTAGSYYEGKWERGEIIHFLAPAKAGLKPSGMVGVIREFRPPEFSSVEHLGMVNEGKVDTSSAEAMSWAPAFENYTLIEKSSGTEFIVEMDVDDTYAEIFEEKWPRALALLKKECEA